MKTLILLLFTISLLFTAGVSSANSADPQTVSFTGTWKTIAGGTHPYTVILKQTGNKVSGSYSPGNGKIFDGVVEDNKLTFNWTQDGGIEGTAEFTMDEDGKGFTGKSKALKPTEYTVSWSSVRPPVISFAGAWETISGGRSSIPLTIVQKGNKVTGLYPGNSGTIEGTVTGRVLRFTWESDGGSGSGRFVMDEGGKSFTGTWNRGDNPDDVESTWNGKRPAPEEKPASSPPSVPFTGVWKGTLAGKSLTLNFQRNGNQVTGLIESDLFGTAAIREGVVEGITLRFKVVRGDGSALGDGELTIREEGKALKGAIGNGSTLVTFIRP